MSSDRPYRKGRPLEAVVQELQKYSGSQFDPNCVEACVRLIDREGEAFIRKDQNFDIDAFLEV
jgi:HD-GYP domain-containing protein (c-di-GMP phosphodiesterase class II)